MEPETVLILGATGNIGVSAVKAALSSNRHVLAIVRNKDSADKLIHHIGSGSSEGITFVEADVLADDERGIKGVVERVSAGEVPGFQHVYSCVGGEYTTDSLLDISTERLRYNMNAMFEAAFFAYRATIPYLLAQPSPTTWTLCTGSQGDIATHPLPAMTQGALFSFALAAARETEGTNVRFNEVYLGMRVEVDEEAVKHGVVRASEFAGVYERVLEGDVKSSRVLVESLEDLENLRAVKRF
ncbi:uncharacterized protein DSM5745_01836 [Aspergillus mulundensis]|uniref:Short-chain dehydrogenase n=1 Tax=Aspergillus mulundensis TaxID=1810919 RepID=A0A3D8SV54_9EURO|nr:Uncharacterized protein DSM5745_01836 [Aspergillus mulundensis]RDW90061.1 Uncharacterized protein DSM5745_01836 [Aspergillus mulundensis]